MKAWELLGNCGEQECHCPWAWLSPFPHLDPDIWEASPQLAQPENPALL